MQKQLIKDLEEFGRSDIILKTDSEPAIVALQNKIQSMRQATTVPRKPPAYNPQAIGSDAIGILEVMGQVRAMKISLEQRINNKMNTECRIMQ